MGGIVVQKALLHSNESAGDIASIVDSSRGVIFMGTSHCESEKADFASFFTSIVKIFHSVNDTMIQALKSQNSDLQEPQRRFNQLLNRRKDEQATIEVQCFCETRPMSGIGGMVVPTYSAAPPTHENPVAIDADHIGMTKFSNRKDQAYRNVLAELKRMMRSAKERGDAENDFAVKSGGATHVGNNDRGTLANYGTQTIGGNNGGTSHYGNTNSFG